MKIKKAADTGEASLWDSNRSQVEISNQNPIILWFNEIVDIQNRVGMRLTHK